MIEVRKYGRHFALCDDGRLLAVCLYRVDAEAVKRRIDGLVAQLAMGCRHEAPDVTEPCLVSEADDLDSQR